MKTFGGAGVKTTPFYISNIIAMKNVGLPLLNTLSNIPGQFTIREEPVVNLIEHERESIPAPIHNTITTKAQSDAQWGVKKIEIYLLMGKLWHNWTRYSRSQY